MQWKNIYWLYIGICLLLIAGIIVGLVFGLRTSSNNTPIILPTVTSVVIVLKEPEPNAESFNKRPSVLEMPPTVPVPELPPTVPVPDLYTIPETSISMSPMATTSAMFGDYLLLGAPKEDEFGKVHVYHVSDHATVDKIHEISFSLTGTSYQLAGYAIDANIVCAPEFGDGVGAFFVLRDLQGDVEIQRETVDLKDGFVMKKRGRIFRYQHPYLYVAKDSLTLTVIDMFEMDENQTNWKFVKRGAVRLLGNRFANDFILKSKSLIVGELNVYHIYDARTLQHVRTVDISNEYKEDVDPNQFMQIDSQGFLVINSPMNRFSLFYDDAMTLVKCERFADSGNCTRYQNASGKIISCDFDRQKIVIS